MKKVDLNSLYNHFFQENKMLEGYKTQKEYKSELFAYLDICLSLSCLYRINLSKTEEKNEILLKEHSISLSLEESIQELLEERKEIKEQIFYKEIKQLLKKASFHINNRLQHTKQKDNFPIYIISTQLHLSKYERFLFLLSFACYETKYETLFYYLQGGEQKPTFRFAAFLYELGGESSSDINRNHLFFTYFLKISQIEGGFDKKSTFLLEKRVYQYLFDDNEIETYLKEFVTFISWQEEIEPILIREDIVKKAILIAESFCSASKKNGNLLQIYGQDGIGKKYLAKQIARQRRSNLLVVDLSRLLDGTMKEIRLFMKQIAIESILKHAMVCFLDPEFLDNRKEQEMDTLFYQKKIGLSYVITQLKTEYPFCFVLTKEKTNYFYEKELHTIKLELPILTIKEKELLWNQYAKQYEIASEVDFSLCANQYVLSIRDIKEVLCMAEQFRCEEKGEKITNKHIRRAIKQLSANQLGKLASIVESVYIWEDLVVSPEQKKQLHMICNQIKYRDVVGEQWGFYKKTSYGRGVCALFYGSPGTGKTMAVQVIANELGLDLYRIDLSQIVSKYIGETEKNITELFERAKHINALLFFDEADALFAKRSEVKDSHDRNANAETAHLLQKLEDYEGITILATNYINNIDDAFKRRIKFMIFFSFPTKEVRYQLWNTILPKEVPCEEELDFEFFAAQFELSGSSIKEILTNAAYIAASQQKRLANCHIVEAIKINFSKFGKQLTDDDFGYLI